MFTPSRVVASRQTMLLLNKEHRLSAYNDSRPICTLRLADRLFDDLFEEHFESLPERDIEKASGYPSQQVSKVIRDEAQAIIKTRAIFSVTAFKFKLSLGHCELIH